MQCAAIRNQDSVIVYHLVWINSISFCFTRKGFTPERLRAQDKHQELGLRI